MDTESKILILIILLACAAGFAFNIGRAVGASEKRFSLADWREPTETEDGYVISYDHITGDFQKLRIKKR